MTHSRAMACWAIVAACGCDGAATSIDAGGASDGGTAEDGARPVDAASAADAGGAADGGTGTVERRHPDYVYMTATPGVSAATVSRGGVVTVTIEVSGSPTTIGAKLRQHVADIARENATEFVRQSYAGNPTSIELPVRADATPGEYYVEVVITAPDPARGGAPYAETAYDYRPSLQLSRDPTDVLGELYAIYYPNGQPGLEYRSPGPTAFPLALVQVE